MNNKKQKKERAEEGDVICAQQAFDQQACRCLKCAPEVRNEVTTPHPITKFAISTFVFQNFDDVLEHCNMLAVQHNLPKVIKGNKQKNTKRVKCSRCNENFMTFKNGRLLSCKSLEEFLTPAHYCIEVNAEVKRLQDTNATLEKALNQALGVDIIHDGNKLKEGQLSVDEQHEWSEEWAKVVSALEAGSQPLLDEFTRDQQGIVFKRMTILESKLATESDALTKLAQMKTLLEADLIDVKRKLDAAAQLWHQYHDEYQQLLNCQDKLEEQLAEAASHHQDQELQLQGDGFAPIEVHPGRKKRKTSTAGHKGDLAVRSTSNTHGSPFLPTSYPFPGSGSSSSSDTAESSLFQWLTEKLRSKPKTELVVDIRLCVQSIVKEGIPDELILPGISPDDVTTRYLKYIGVSSVITQKQQQRLYKWLIHGQRALPTAVQQENETLVHADAAAVVTSSETVMLVETTTADEKDLIDEMDSIITIANVFDTRKQMMQNVRTLLEKVGLFPAKEQRPNAVADEVVVVNRNELAQEVQELTDRYARMEIETKNCTIC